MPEQTGTRTAEEVVMSEEIEDAADEFEQEIVETFGVDPADIEITAEEKPITGASYDVVSLKARWKVA